jgi:hypothetical protein
MKNNKIITNIYKCLNSIITMNKNLLIQLKETIFLYLFSYCFFDLSLMQNINIVFDNLIKECCEQ